jgi:hypothetical protein
MAAAWEEDQQVRKQKQDQGAVEGGRTRLHFYFFEAFCCSM